VRHRQIHARLLAILDNMVARERGGEIVERQLLRAITQVGYVIPRISNHA
jgi:hypothetical protein